MKNLHFFYFFIIFPFFTVAQDLSKVDEIVIDRFLKIKNIEHLSEKINHTFTSDLEKARAIYCYIGNTIAYDVEAWQRPSQPFSYTYSNEAEKQRILEEYKYNTAEKTLREAKGVCDGYSKLFEVLCVKVGVECQTIEGTSKAFISDLKKSNPKQITNDHAWNVIKIDHQWHLIDVTWASGGIDDNLKFYKKYTDIYFMMDPEQFVLNHYPSDQKWTLCDITKQQFLDFPIYYLSYFENNIKLISPKSKVFSDKKGGQLVFEKGTDVSQMLFGFSGDKYALDVEIEEIDSKILINVPSTEYRSELFTIFYKNESIVTFITN
ncbi:transglutaminase domain-containing protein [Flammeovirga sp. SubArs3]|uniref:transglutaminase domain-containing protein n=1 Tax=Flammeovirga sp. SubArs3 TaxID=2995316 RepID=UPI00248C3A65|nr:transglutaminase domain-containing protein [Flammeovirga sp. SubArs3]